MSATFAKLFSSVCPRAGDLADHFSGSMPVKTTNRSARSAVQFNRRSARDEVSEVDEFVGAGRDNSAIGGAIPDCASGS
jgi:hypothetical protein